MKLGHLYSPDDMFYTLPLKARADDRYANGIAINGGGLMAWSIDVGMKWDEKSFDIFVRVAKKDPRKAIELVWSQDK
jgi:hypothetical protein